MLGLEACVEFCAPEFVEKNDFGYFEECHTVGVVVLCRIDVLFVVQASEYVRGVTRCRAFVVWVWVSASQRTTFLFWRETHTKGWCTRSPTRPEEGEGRKVPE